MVINEVVVALWLGEMGEKDSPGGGEAHVVLAQQTHAVIEGDRCDCVQTGNSGGTGGCAEETCVFCVLLPNQRFSFSSLRGLLILCGAQSTIAVCTVMKDMCKQCLSVPKKKKPTIS